MPASITAEMRAKASSPEARKKAIATFKRTIAEKKAAKAAKEKEGSTTTFNVGDLRALGPRPKKQPKIRKGHRRTFTPAEKLAYVARVEAAIAREVEMKKALDDAGIHDSQFRMWRRQATKLQKLAAKGAPHPASALRQLARGKPKKKTNGAARAAVFMNDGAVHSFYDAKERALKVCLHIKGEDVLVTTEEALSIRTGLTQMGF